VRRIAGAAGDNELSQPAKLCAKLLDVLGVEVDRFLVGLQALLDSGVVALVSRPDALLLGELLLSVRKQLLFVLELRFEDLAAILVAIDVRR
jgi:hypothetical protein